VNTQIVDGETTAAMGGRIATRAGKLLRDRVILDCLFVPLPDENQVERLRAGGVTTVHTTVAIFEDFRGLVGRILDLQQVVERHGGAVRIVGSVEEILSARSAGKIGVILGTQNTTPIEDDERLVGAMRRLGIRVVQLTYNNRNLVGDGCAETGDAGLSAFGRRVVAALNEERMLIDLSHVGQRTAREAIDTSSAPVVITHSNARALCNHPRNLPDETIRAVAARGGVIGVNGFPGFLLSEPHPKPTVHTLIDHMLHIAGIAGPHHVGIGLDLDEADTPPEHYLTWDGQPGLGRHPFPQGFLPPWPWIYAIRSMADFMDIPEAMLQRGFSEDDVVGILGENFLRVFRTVWGE
jgi:membrane dipeptidase